MATTDFATRKQTGTAAEVALRDLLVASGALVTANQINRDTTHAHPGAAVAHVADGGPLHLPDLTAHWPDRGLCPTMHFEAKAKRSPAGGAWGWDQHAFARAERWGLRTGQPVYYAVRDLSAGELPPAGQLDDPLHWWVASTWKLAEADRLSDSNGRFWFWPTSIFLPLPLVLDGGFAVQTVAYYRQADGRPELL